MRVPPTALRGDAVLLVPPRELRGSPVQHARRERECGRRHQRLFGPPIHDSVDPDDGAFDGSGLLGDDYFSRSGSTGIVFTFSAAVLGALPTHAGLVWTDGDGGATSRRSTTTAPRWA